MPYVAAHPLEFQTLGQWAASGQGLGPVEATMLIALPEIDGATNPTVFAGRHGARRLHGLRPCCRSASCTKAMAPCHERIESLAARTERLALLRRKRNAEKKVGIVLFGFPPNAGAVGTAAYLSVFESLHNTLTAHEGRRLHGRGARERRCPARGGARRQREQPTARRPTSRPMWPPTPSCATRRT